MQVFARRALILLMGLMGVGLIGGISLAQDENSDMPLFVHIPYAEDYSLLSPSIETGDDSIVIESYDGSFGFYAEWNTDGTQLAMLHSIISGGEHHVFNIETNEYFAFNHPQPNNSYRVAWTQDDQLLLARQIPSPDLEFNMVAVEIFTNDPLVPDFDESMNVLGSYAHGVGCGGGTDIPAQIMSSLEDAPSLFAETPYGILHHDLCSVGVALLNPATGEDVQLGYLRSAALSADRTHVAGSINEDDRILMMTIDLATQEARAYEIPQHATAIAWSQDGETIYFASREQQFDLMDLLSQDQREFMIDTFGYQQTLTRFAVSVYALTISSEEVREIYTAEAYNIPRMLVIDSELYLIEIPDQYAWLEAVAVRQEASPRFEQSFQYVLPYVHRMPLDNPAQIETLGPYLRFIPYTE